MPPSGSFRLWGASSRNLDFVFLLVFVVLHVSRRSRKLQLILCRKKKKEARERKAPNGMVVIAQADALRGAAVPMADEEGDSTSTESRCGIKSL